MGSFVRSREWWQIEKIVICGIPLMKWFVIPIAIVEVRRTIYDPCKIISKAMQIYFPFCVNLGRTFFQNTAKITQEMGNKTEFYDCPQRKVRFYHFKPFATDLISFISSNVYSTGILPKLRGAEEDGQPTLQVNFVADSNSHIHPILPCICQTNCDQWATALKYIAEWETVAQFDLINLSVDKNVQEFLPP